jgi:hypothetical protein
MARRGVCRPECLNFGEIIVSGRIKILVAIHQIGIKLTVTNDAAGP